MAATLSSVLQTTISRYNHDVSEIIQFSENITKINKKNKKQERMFVLTDKAIYNIKPKNNQIQRRINLLDIASITCSSVSTEFTINIPSEYDYRYQAKDVCSQNEIILAISKQILALEHDILINKIDHPTTAQWTITKNVLKKVSAHYDDTINTVMALDHLTAMGFKQNMARNSLNRNKGNLSITIQSLIVDFVEESEKKDNKVLRSPFTSPAISPVTSKISSCSTTPSLYSPYIHLSPKQSVTEPTDDMFTIRMEHVSDHIDDKNKPLLFNATK